MSLCTSRSCLLIAKYSICVRQCIDEGVGLYNQHHYLHCTDQTIVWKFIYNAMLTDNFFLCNLCQGTIVLWVCWPSFNAVLVDGVSRNRAIVNTYYAIITSCVTACAFSSLMTRGSKLSMVGTDRLVLVSQIVFDVEPQVRVWSTVKP